MDFVIIANDWAAGVDNPTSKHRIALELVRRGNRVLWLEGAGMRPPALGSDSDRSRIARKLKATFRRPRPIMESPNLPGKIWVLTPPLLPVPHLAWVRKLNGVLYGNIGAFWARRLGFQSPAMINYVPILAEAMPSWPWQRIYHCVDRWDAFGMYDSGLMCEMDARCCRYAGQVIASSQDLAERCLRHNRLVALVMHGVDHAHFASALDSLPRPADLPQGNIAGFFGLVSEWLDQELIVKLARALPDAHVALIGRSDVDIERLRGIPNLHLLGPRPFDQLPAYLASFEVGLIPFVVNDLTRAVNPIKLREMLAGGCPVVSTSLPEVAKYARRALGAVDVAGNHDDFIRAVQCRLARRISTGQRQSISRSMESETWAAKVDEILHALSAKGGQTA